MLRREHGTLIISSLVLVVSSPGLGIVFLMSGTSTCSFSLSFLFSLFLLSLIALYIHSNSTHIHILNSLMRYLEFSEKFFLLIFTLRYSFSNVIRFLISIAPIFFGYVVFGVIVFSNYTIEVEQLNPFRVKFFLSFSLLIVVSFY